MKIGNNRIIANIENISPPMVPAASGNQNDNRVSPIRNGIKPKIVDNTVSKTDLILKLNAST